MKQLLFLDRDGVINVDMHFVSRVEDIVFIEGIFKLCSYFRAKNFEIVIVTNQSGLAKGLFTQQELQRVMNYILEKFKSEGIEILAYYYCPHAPVDLCKCRKPLPGMFIQAIKKFNVSAKDCISVGDRARDIIAANAAGIYQNYLLAKDDLIANHLLGPIIVSSLAEIIEIHQSTPANP
jgi:D-glycero-D-manno-heptose 1,7-bisphosphate phosphatase